MALGGRAFNSQLESLRGIAALMVALFHIGQTRAGEAALVYGALPDDPRQRLIMQAYKLIANGDAAVVLFFVLSGHVLMQSLERSQGTLLQISAAFAIRRFLRILPPVAFMIACFCAVYVVTGLMLPGILPQDYSPHSLLRHVLLLTARINGVAWSLQVEMLGAAVVLATWLAYKRFKIGALWTVAILLYWANFNKAFSFAFSDFIDPNLRFFRLMYAFPAGMLILPLLERFDLKRLPPLVRITYPLLGIALIFLSVYIFGKTSLFRVLGEVIGTCMVIAGVILGLNQRLGTILDRKIFRFYGRISYSFYLLHPLSFILFWNMPDQFETILQAGYPAPIVALGLMLLSLAMVTPLALFSYAFIERPSIRLGRRIVAALSSALPKRPE